VSSLDAGQRRRSDLLFVTDDDTCGEEETSRRIPRDRSHPTLLLHFASLRFSTLHFIPFHLISFHFARLGLLSHSTITFAERPPFSFSHLHANNAFRVRNDTRVTAYCEPIAYRSRTIASELRRCVHEACEANSPAPVSTTSDFTTINGGPAIRAATCYF